MKIWLPLLLIFMIGYSSSIPMEDAANIPDNESAEEPAQESINTTKVIVIEIDETEPVKNTVSIKDLTFDPVNMTIYKGESITWIADTPPVSFNQPRLVVCRNSSGIRIFMGERMTELGQEVSYTFPEPGEYLCQEAVYGLRSHIKVKSIYRPNITGAVIGPLDSISILGGLLVAVLAVISISFILKRKFLN